MTTASDPIDVLLVDDDEQWAESTAQILERQREALTVETATSVTEAEAAFAESDPECVVCDYDLGEGTGFEFLETVRARDDRPFVLITGQGNEAVASEAVGRDVTDYIPKRSLGGEGDRLARRIEAAVSSYRTRLALERERRGKEAMLDIVRATSSRDGVAQEFCEHLVREHEYACAWIGTRGDTGSAVPRAVAGERAYVDEVVGPGAGAIVGPGAGETSRHEPARQALSEQEPVYRTAIDSEAAEWAETAVDHGIRSAAAIPIEHRDTVFGVLAVYRTAPGFEAGEPELLGEYAETIGYALRSAEWKESLFSTSAVAIEIAVGDRSHPLVALDRDLPGTADIEVLTTVGREETVLYVLRVTGVSTAALREAVAPIETIDDLTVESEAAPLRCDLAVGRPTLGTTIADRGGRVVDVSLDAGRVRVQLVLPEESGLDPLIEAVRSTYPDAGVRSVRRSSAGTERVDPEQLLASLTEKQRTALEMAFYNGFFERPREHNTTEIAEKVGVSRQTFTQHLRAGERKLLADLLEGPDE